MRVFGILAVFVASVAARGSGPYLPSGWKPDGPAFYLPSEVAKPKENPIKEIVFQESEASGSDSLREYGPPKLEVSLELSKQGLPDAVTEQTFADVVLKVEEVVEEKAVTESSVIVEDSEAKLSEQSFVQELAPVTEALATEGPTTLSDTQVIVDNIEIQADIELTTEVGNEVTATVVETKTEDVKQVSVESETKEQEVEVKVEQQDEEVKTEQVELKFEQQVAVNDNQEQDVKSIQQENENANSDIVSTVEQRLQVQEVQTVQEEIQKVETEVKRVETEIQKVETQFQNFETEVKTVEQLVQNIPEVLINIENENKEKQVENLEQVPESKVILETFGSLEQAPEGFLEYGPPGFTEYGPPKDDLLKPVSEEITPELQSIESNEARKRRYSPKFRIARKANRH